MVMLRFRKEPRRVAHGVPCCRTGNSMQDSGAHRPRRNRPTTYRSQEIVHIHTRGSSFSGRARASGVSLEAQAQWEGNK